MKPEKPKQACKKGKNEKHRKKRRIAFQTN